MPRPTLTPAQRAKNVATAADRLSALVAHAQDLATRVGADHPSTLEAWETVETQGAIVHRQSRLLAGKSKGG